MLNISNPLHSALQVGSNPPSTGVLRVVPTETLSRAAYIAWELSSGPQWFCETIPIDALCHQITAGPIVGWMLSSAYLMISRFLPSNMPEDWACPTTKILHWKKHLPPVSCLLFKSWKWTGVLKTNLICRDRWKEVLFLHLWERSGGYGKVLLPGSRGVRPSVRRAMG